MIGPGWMPSRPRPIARRKLLLCSIGYTRRRRPRRTTRTERVPSAASIDDAMLDHGGGAPAPLPIATLRPTTQAWHQLAVGDLQRWLGERWLWLRPRSVPILVAFAAMLAMLDAAKHLAIYAHCDHVVRIEAARPMPRYVGTDDLRPRPLLVPSTSSRSAAHP
jgi:hypothetical protein